MCLIETERLVLKPFQLKDLDPMTAINQDLNVMAYFPATQDHELTRQFIQKMQVHYANHGISFLACDLKTEARLIGFIGLMHTDFAAPFTPNVEIGWRIAHRCWGKGLATEGAKAVMAYGYQALKLPEIVSFTVVANKRSRRVMEKLGMQHCPQEDFDHPRLPADSPLRRHVLYRKRY